jgi:hypothetical protein
MKRQITNCPNVASGYWDRLEACFHDDVRQIVGCLQPAGGNLDCDLPQTHIAHAKQRGIAVDLSG